MMPDSRSEPTPTPPGRCRIRLQKPWGILWRRSCKTTAENKTPGRRKKLPVWRFLSLSGHFGVWVTVWVRPVDPDSDPHEISQNCNKNSRNPVISGVFWSCWADSNRRPHPYQGCALPTELQQQTWRPGTGSNRRPLA